MGSQSRVLGGWSATRKMAGNGVVGSDFKTSFTQKGSLSILSRDKRGHRKSWCRCEDCRFGDLPGPSAALTSFDQGPELFKVVDDKIRTRTCEFLLCELRLFAEFAEHSGLQGEP
jgi:hypothetical protein